MNDTEEYVVRTTWRNLSTVNNMELLWTMQGNLYCEPHGGITTVNNTEEFIL